MSHTYEGGQGTRIFHDNDVHARASDVTIRRPAANAIGFTETNVPVGDLLDFVAHLVRNGRISKLEDMGTEELLGIEPRRRR